MHHWKLLSHELSGQVLHSNLITWLSGETCTATPSPMNALVALEGIANERQLVAVQKHCNQMNESNNVLKLFHLKFSISNTISLLDDFTNVCDKGLIY